jgi:hypothetical protein
MFVGGWMCGLCVCVCVCARARACVCLAHTHPRFGHHSTSHTLTLESESRAFHPPCRCLHKGYLSDGGPVEWSTFLADKAKQAADDNSICASSDTNFVYFQTPGAATE